MEKINLAIAIIMAVVAFCSLATALLSFLSTKKITQAQIETNILQQINDAERHKDKTALEYKKAQITNNPTEIALAKNIFDSAIQQLLNVYDEICGLYIDRKIDRKRFIKSYSGDIIALVEAECYAEFYKSKESKSYSKTLYIYYEVTKQI